MSLRTLAMVGAALAVLGPAMLAAQSVGSYNAVTEQRLLNPEPQNWLMYRGNYSGWGYSPLDRITPGNVNQRSEEHTSELQSRQYLVCRLLLEKKNKTTKKKTTHKT